MNLRLFLVLFLLLCCAGSWLGAQKVLRVEKEGRIKTWKYYSGDEIYMKSVFSPKEWTKVSILEIRPEDHTVVFDRTVLKVEEILALKPVSRVRNGRSLQRIFTTFAASLTVFSLADPILGREYRWDALAYAGGSVVVGVGLNGIFNASQFRFDRTHRIRLLDLSPRNSVD